VNAFPLGTEDPCELISAVSHEKTAWLIAAYS
jgi:hypothetical protein